MKALFISLLCLLSIIFPHDICADNSNQDKENILIITSYNSDSKYIYNNIRQFINIYKEIGGSYGIVVENMNETQLTNGHDWVTIVEELTLKHDDAKLIILLGGEAWNGYLFSNNEKIKNIPAICAMGSRYGFTLPDKKNDIHTYIPKSIDLIDEMKNSNVKACYAYDYKMDENIQLVQYFYPDLNHIVFLSDNTYSGLTQQAQIRECLNKNYPQLKTTFIDGRNITMEEAINSVGNLSTQNTVMMMGIWRLDKQNFYFIDNASYAFKMANARLPLFTITSAGLGYWAIGGITPLYDNVSEKLAHKDFQIVSYDKEISQ